MAGIWRAQVELAEDSGLPEDVTVNTWHFAYIDAGGANPAAALIAFYQAIDTYLAENLTGDGNIKFYDLADPEPRTPIGVVPFTFTPGTSNLPAEVALCQSYRAQIESGGSPARRKGRNFIGPLADDALASATGRPDSAFMLALANAAAAVLAASAAASNWDWVVYSPTDNVARLVVAGWVDDEFDTIRSRGKRATSRINWDVTGTL